LDALQWKCELPPDNLIPCNGSTNASRLLLDYLIYTIWLGFELGWIYAFAVETKGRSLEETAALFDGEDAVQELTDRTRNDMVEGGQGLGGVEKRTRTPSTDEKHIDDHV